MPDLPVTDYFTDPPVIDTVVLEKLAPKLFMVGLVAPWQEVGAQSISYYQKTYAPSDDPETLFPPAGASDESAWPLVTATVGEPISKNTSKRKLMASFPEGIESNPTVMDFINDTYSNIAYGLAYQVQLDLITKLKADAAAQTTQFTANKGDVWSASTADVVKAISGIAEDMEVKEGYQLETVLVHTTNFYEAIRSFEKNDADYDYLREQVVPDRNVWKERVKAVRIKNLGINLVGLQTGMGLSEGAIIGVGTAMGAPAVKTFHYDNPKYVGTSKDISGDIEDFIPLAVNPYVSQDGMTRLVKLWIDAYVAVKAPYGVFYSSTGV